MIDDIKSHLNHIPGPLQKLIIGALACTLLVLIYLLAKSYTGSGGMNGSQQTGGNTSPAGVEETATPKSNVVVFASEGETFNSEMKKKGTFSTKVGQLFTVAVNLEGAPVDAADVVVSYDNKTLEYVSRNPTSLLPQLLLNKTESTNVYYSGSVDPQNPTGVTNGSILYITFRAKSVSSGSQIMLDPVKTVVAAKGQNATGTVESLTVVVE
ncbi:MAG: cohesin domain-containing protein [bacterium]|nr:cohesin domain-containing protein [bacterium]